MLLWFFSVILYFTGNLSRAHICTETMTSREVCCSSRNVLQTGTLEILTSSSSLNSRSIDTNYREEVNATVVRNGASSIQFGCIITTTTGAFCSIFHKNITVEGDVVEVECIYDPYGSSHCNSSNNCSTSGTLKLQSRRNVIITPTSINNGIPLTQSCLGTSMIKLQYPKSTHKTLPGSIPSTRPTNIPYPYLNLKSTHKTLPGSTGHTPTIKHPPMHGKVETLEVAAIAISTLVGLIVLIMVFILVFQVLRILQRRRSSQHSTSEPNGGNNLYHNRPLPPAEPSHYGHDGLTPHSQAMSHSARIGIYSMISTDDVVNRWNSQFINPSPLHFTDQHVYEEADKYARLETDSDDGGYVDPHDALKDQYLTPLKITSLSRCPSPRPPMQSGASARSSLYHELEREEPSIQSDGVKESGESSLKDTMYEPASALLSMPAPSQENSDQELKTLPTDVCIQEYEDATLIVTHLDLALRQIEANKQ